MAETDILLAAERMHHVNEPLIEALEKLGEPLPAEYTHHGHDHHHAA